MLGATRHEKAEMKRAGHQQYRYKQSCECVARQRPTAQAGSCLLQPFDTLWGDASENRCEILKTKALGLHFACIQYASS